MNNTWLTVHSGVVLLICSSCVIGYAKVKRTPHLRFTLAYKALVLGVYWLLRNKWAVYRAVSCQAVHNV